MTMSVHSYRPRQFHRTSNGENPSSSYRDMGSASLAAARPTEPWWQYPSSSEAWGVKRKESADYIFKHTLNRMIYLAKQNHQKVTKNHYKIDKTNHQMQVSTICIYKRVFLQSSPYPFIIIIKIHSNYFFKSNTISLNTMVIELGWWYYSVQCAVS